MGELTVGLTDYFTFYNEKRSTSRWDKTRQASVQNAIGGGAMIVDKFPRAVEPLFRYAPQRVPPSQKQKQRQSQKQKRQLKKKQVQKQQ